MGGKKELSGETEVVWKKILVVVRRGLGRLEGGPYYTGREGKAGKISLFHCRARYALTVL